MVQLTPNNKPGYKTTEFWMSLVAVLLGALFSSGAVVEGSSLASLLGIVTTVMASLGYTVSRSVVKTGQTKADVEMMKMSAEHKMYPVKKD